MKSLEQSVLIWYSSQQMFDLVTDVACYPQFLPWCDSARILETRQTLGDEGQNAEIGIAFAGVQQRFSTRNTHIRHDDGVLEDRMSLLSGPFSSLQGQWLFSPVGDIEHAACRITLKLSYTFSSSALEAVVGPVFNKITNSLVNAFVKRAEQVYGLS